MKPRKRITRRVPLPRGKPPRARKKDPAKRRFAKHRCGPFLAWLREQPCCITGKRTGEWGCVCCDLVDWSHPIVVDAAHIKTRATGGDDIGNALPLDHALHMTQHVIGWPAFEKRYGIDRKALAKKYADEWLAAHPGGGPQ